MLVDDGTNQLIILKQTDINVPIPSLSCDGECVVIGVNSRIQRAVMSLL